MRALIYTGILIIVLTMQACSDFLELEPESGIAPGNFFQNEQDALRALTGVYDILSVEETYGNNLWNNLGLGTDVAVLKRSRFTSHIGVNNYTAGERIVLETWEALYDGINRANLFLEEVPAIDMDEEQKQRLLGEVRFLRAFFYFDLVRLWGDVPLLLESTKSVFNVKIARDPLAKVYEQIIEDMEYAEERVFPASRFVTAEHGRVCQGAVQGMLARVNLTMAGEPLRDVTRYQETLKWAQKVKDSGEHGLLDNQHQVFINLTADIFDMRESMFEIVFFGDRTGDTESWRFGNLNGIRSGNIDYGFAWAFFGTTKKLYDLYEPTDARRDVAIATYSVLSNGDKRFYEDTDIWDREPGKWDRQYSSLKDKNFTSTNYPVMRYADVLLMLAEAENEVNGPTQKALDALNAVRIRDEQLATNNTGATPFNLNGPEVADKDAFRNTIIDERARELCNEGERKRDLIRWGIYITTVKSLAAQIRAEYPDNRQYQARVGDNVEEKYLLLPIPTKEIEINPALKQNPGW